MDDVFRVSGLLRRSDRHLLSGILALISWDTWRMSFSSCGRRSAPDAYARFTYDYGMLKKGQDAEGLYELIEKALLYVPCTQYLTV